MQPLIFGCFYSKETKINKFGLCFPPFLPVLRYGGKKCTNNSVFRIRRLLTISSEWLYSTRILERLHLPVTLWMCYLYGIIKLCM